MNISKFQTPRFSLSILCIAIASVSCTALAQGTSLASADSPAAENNTVENSSTAKKAQMKKMVVTATRTPRLLQDSPVPLEVVEGETLRKVSQTTLARALDFLPGVVVKRSPKEGYNVYMQGFDGDRVLILIDGRRVVAPTGVAVDLDQISIANVERIEIMRGAGSVLYGSSAMGGVINVITRQDTSNRLSFTSEVTSYVGNEIDGNEFGYQQRLEGSGKWNAWRGKINLQRIDDAGFDYQPETVSQTAADVKKTFAQFALGRDFESFSADYRGQVFDEEKYRDSFRLPGQSTVIYYKTDVEQVQHDLEFRDVPASEEERNNAGGWKVNSRYTTHEEVSGDSNGLRNTDITLAELDSQKVWMGEGYEMVGGMSARYDQLEQLKGEVVEVADESSEGYEGFFQYSKLSAASEWIAGARAQHDSDFGWDSALRVSGMKKFSTSENSQWRLRSGLGQSYRVPSIKERFYVFDHSNLGYMVLGNSELQPETALSGNINLGHLLAFEGDAGSIDSEFNVHYSEAKNLIETVSDDEATQQQGIAIYRYQNFAKTQIYGADLSSKYQYKNWSTQLNYSYLYAEDKLTGERLPNRPRHQIKANLGYHFPRYDLDSLLYVVYEKDEFSGTTGRPVVQDNYLTVNFNLSQRINQHFSWRLGVENMFDEHQDPLAVSAGEFDQRPITSRRVYAGITYNFF